MLVSSDFLTDKNYPALNKGKGDAFMIVGATLYGFSEYSLAVIARFNCAKDYSQPMQQKNSLLDDPRFTR